MDIGEQSVEFIKNQMEINFKEIMSSYVVETMYWIETSDGARGVAEMYKTPKNNNENNLICLFPPFIPKD